jgi:hypothetical protein
MAVTAGSLKKILENVPDDYVCTILLEGMAVESVEVKDDEKIVDFAY